VILEVSAAAAITALVRLTDATASSGRTRPSPLAVPTRLPAPSGLGFLLVALVVGVMALTAILLAESAARRRVRARLGPPAPPAGGAKAGDRVATPVAALGGIGLVVAWAAVGPLAAAALMAASLAVPATAWARRRGLAKEMRQRQLPGALEGLASALRSGSSLGSALDEVGAALAAPIGPELAGIAREAARGRSLRDALDDWSRTHDDPGTRLAATALVLAAVVGSAPAQAVDGVATTVRERLDLAAERRALATQARTSALVLTIAPVGFAALLVLTDTEAGRFLLGSPAGWACLALGTVLDATGAWWMARLSAVDVS
jgi:tight adherence protein B